MFHFNANVIMANEEERLEQIRIENVQRRIMREESDCFAIDDIRFVELFRVTKDLAQYIINRIAVDIQNENVVAVPVQVKFFCAMQFYATGSYQRVIGRSYNISASQQTISKIIKEVTAAIVRNFAEQWIQFPKTLERKNFLKQRFMEKNGFPGVIGAVDCTHIEILKPREEEHTYLNRKGYHSKNIQIICDSDLKILNINSSYGGATHDAFIFRNSLVCQAMETSFHRGDRNTWLVGDSGYPQLPFLMTPIPNADPGTPEYRYTQCHITTRNCVERCIGILKGRFLCISKILRYSPEQSGTIANACAILHNMCCEARLDENFLPPPVQNEEVPPYEVVHEPLNREGNVVRRDIINRYFM